GVLPILLDGRDRLSYTVVGDGDGEDAAGALLALHLDRAAHRLDEARHDRQAEARAAVSAGVRRVGLHERLEDALAHGQGNADAGVADIEADRVRAARDLHRDLALL